MHLAKIENIIARQNWAYSVADLNSKILDARPPRGPNSFNFMQFLGKFGKIVCWRPPGELAPPPQGNPRSAADIASGKILQQRNLSNESRIMMAGA